MITLQVSRTLEIRIMLHTKTIQLVRLVGDDQIVTISFTEKELFNLARSLIVARLFLED